MNTILFCKIQLFIAYKSKTLSCVIGDNEIYRSGAKCLSLVS